MSGKRERDTKSLISAIEKAISSENDLARTIEEMLEFILKIMHAEAVSFLLKDDEQDALQLVAVKSNEPLPMKKGDSYPVDKGIQSIVLGKGESYISTDLKNSMYYTYPRECIESEMAVPVKWMDEIIGMLNVGSTQIMSCADEALLQSIANSFITSLELQRLYNIEKSIRTEREPLSKESCFVLIPFGDPFNKYYNAVISPTIEAVGLYSVRADSLFGPANIMQDIWVGIKKARLLIAELTTRNPNVMYELGLAHAMSKPVILLTQNIEDVPFDLRSIRCIVYDTVNPDWATALRLEIASHIEAILKTPKRTHRFLPFVKR